MNVKVLNNQRLVDLCMQEYGDAAFLFEAAAFVGKSITDDLVDVFSLDLQVLDTTASGKSISVVLKKIYNIPASADDNAINFFLPPGGIGYMKIINPAVDPVNADANDFIVS